MFQVRFYSEIAHRSVAVAMSGGIDSSVTALLLKKMGYNVTGVFMKNWDITDETDGEKCNYQQDLADLKDVCKRIDIPLVEVSFIKEYWCEVFLPFLEAYESGFSTPNPDVSCNRYIKFDKFKSYLENELKINTVATGHYARLTFDTLGKPLLHRGIDITKDQSYFLSTTNGQNFLNTLFPIGGMTKKEVKLIAENNFQGLNVLTKKESMGICFIGKRHMGDFLSKYIKPKINNFYVNIENNEVVGKINNGKHIQSFFTIGQGARIGGCDQRYFVVKKNIFTGDIIVAPGSNHPSLYINSLVVQASSFNWISGQIPNSSRDKFSNWELSCFCQFRNLQNPLPCIVSLIDISELAPVLNSSVEFISPISDNYLHACKDIHSTNIIDGSARNYSFKIRFPNGPVRATSPGQILVLYDNDICLGGGEVLTTFSSYVKKYHH